MIKKITFILITFILFQSSYANQCSYNDIEVEIKRFAITVNEVETITIKLSICVVTEIISSEDLVFI